MKNFNILYEDMISSYSGNKKAVFVFGRFNPPTAGHEMLINHAIGIAETENRELFVFVSRGTGGKDKKKKIQNPLVFDDKVELLDEVFPDVKFVTDPMAINPYNAGYWLRDHGITNVKMVAGSDRIKEFTDGFKQYIGHEDPKLDFGFKRFKVESVGEERDPDSDDISGISASRARELARIGNLDGFIQILPANANRDMVEGLYTKIRARLRELDVEVLDPPEEDLGYKEPQTTFQTKGNIPQADHNPDATMYGKPVKDMVPTVAGLDKKYGKPDR